MRVMTTNYCSEAATTITASSANSLFPASNLKHPHRSKRLRTATGTTTLNVVFDMQTTEAVNSVVFLWPKEDGIRLSASAVVKIQANATNVWTAPAVNQTLTIDNDYMVASHFFTTDQSYRYWRAVIEDPSNPYGYVEIGVVWIGKSLTLDPAQNGFKFQLQDLSKVTTTDFGHRYTDEYPTVASLEFTYALLNYSEAKILENAFRKNGTRKPVLVCLDESEAVFDKDHFLIYGGFESRFGLGHQIHQIINVDTIRIEELS